MNQLWFSFKMHRSEVQLKFIFTIIVLTVTDHHDRKLPKFFMFFDKVESTSDAWYSPQGRIMATSLNAIRKMQKLLTGNRNISKDFRIRVESFYWK